MRYNKLKYGKELQKLLNCYIDPERLVDVCIAYENTMSELNTDWNDGKITEDRYNESIAIVLEDMWSTGISLQYLEIDGDCCGIAIKVTKKGWPYTDFGGLGVLVHESFL